MRDALLVALGAVPGAWLRFRLVNHFQPLVPRRHWGTFGVNVVACFVLGLLSALEARCGPAAPRLALLLTVGFLGSLSTFSSFCVELLQALQSGQEQQGWLLAAASLLAGLAAVGLGLVIGG
ncbi:CrcB family protein [Synechococcus sp. CCY9201]|uniref:fluoride efflux transporter FluC n=1 Tax=unclassified Synechococcus TaxID=2626047 RepID=UPI0018CE59A4|nr:MULTISPECIES: CrcB family protein [unclassified Synechococcus]MEA5472745.1 CrcB family protein [Synechococcus sp. CCY9201]QPN60951.1 CrcB family protein [Synechococcus sp. CBW1002]CAK6702027.1 Putative fluoride ion transporter CrcB [Synechococcus sp. CBW1107]